MATPKPRLTELTPEQWEDVAKARDATLNRCLVDPIDWNAFTQAAADIYKSMGDPAPTVVVAPGPNTALAWAAHLQAGAAPEILPNIPNPPPKEIKDQLQNVHWPWWRHAWLSHWLHVATIEGIEPPAEDILAQARAYQTFTVPPLTIPLDKAVVACGRWTELHRTADGLHRTDGPAWAWSDSD
jgi:hypothetical protein